MNSYTKPRHENKQDLIYSLPVSRQMPGRAGSTAGQGGIGNQCGWILAWEGQEGSVPSPPMRAAAPHAEPCTPQQPHAIPQSPPGAGAHRMGTVAARAGAGLPGPRLAAPRDAECGRHWDGQEGLLLPPPVSCARGCQGIAPGLVRPCQQHQSPRDQAPIRLWKLQAGGSEPTL